MGLLLSLESGYSYSNTISHLFEDVHLKDCIEEFADNPTYYDAVLFTGGQDVHPALYGHRHYLRSPISLGKRDVDECFVYNVARKWNIPMLGICRGSQFLATMLGCTLIQDMTGHIAGTSTPITAARLPMGTGSVDIVGECYHHQMVDASSVPSNVYIIAAAKEKQSMHYMGNEGLHPPVDMEVEGIYCEKPLVFGVQWHAEAMDETSTGYQYFIAGTQYLLGKSHELDREDTSARTQLLKA